VSQNERLLVGLIYRSPSSSQQNNDMLLSTINRALELDYSNYLFFGDFNYEEIDWNSIESTVGVLHPATKFLNCTQDNYLFQHVSSPTRFREGQTPSCLELVLTNEENMVDTDSLIIDSPLGKGDHAVIHFDYLCSCNTSIDDTEKFQFFKGKYNLMSDELSDIDWDTLFENKNVEEMWNIFKSNETS